VAADGVLERSRGESERGGIDIGEHGRGAGELDGGYGGDGGMRYRKDRVAGSDTTGAQGQMQGVGSAGHAERMGGSQVARKFMLEAGGLAAEDIRSGFEHVVNGRFDLWRKGQVAGFRIGGWNVRHAAAAPATARTAAARRRRS